MKLKNKLIQTLTATSLLASLTLSVSAKDKPLPDPDGKPADMTKPVQVYILLGQSNMLGAGRVSGDKDGTLERAVKEKKLYTLEELNGHKLVLEDLIDSSCVCMNNPQTRESITETLSIVHAMLTAVTTQLENQSISFTP